MLLGFSGKIRRLHFDSEAVVVYYIVTAPAGIAVFTREQQCPAERIITRAPRETNYHGAFKAYKLFQILTSRLLHNIDTTTNEFETFPK